MKARVKATGEIVDILPYVEEDRNVRFYANMEDKWYEAYEIDLVSETLGKFAETCLNGIKQDIVYDPDYWTRLEHQYAGMIVQGMVEHNGINFLNDAILNVAVQKAHALVEKLKEKEER